ncbi:hypothetical protein PBRA_007889 [Plasmodiophora brassicae]|uniref:Uncharacterized protein n=1 Tax=Plasmodiophora brassicae TaxID=37360 RepID=A0A0G4IYR5_PLABS|nr:hypothetical protein PBRA_007889 [Plasmodiophora brassicae]
MSSGNRTHRIVVSPGLLLTFILAVNVIDAARLISKDGAVFMLNDIIPLAQHSRMIQRMINAGVDRIGNVLLPNVFDSHLRLIVGFAKRFSPLEKKYQVHLAADWLQKRFQELGQDGTVGEFVQALEYLQMPSMLVAMGWMLRLRFPDWLACTTDRAAFRERPEAYRLIAGPIRLYHLAKKYRDTNAAEHICNLVVSGSNASHVDAKVWGWGGNVLHCAAHDGEEFVVDMLLHLSGIKVNAHADRDLKKTPLHYAAEEGHPVVVRLLLQHPDIQVNARDDDDCAPLHLARSGDVVRELLHHPGVNVNVEAGQPQWTPLLLAAQQDRAEVVEALLLAADIRVNQPSANMVWTPLHWAASLGHIDVVQVLLRDKRVEINPLDLLRRTPLTLAMLAGRPTIAVELAAREATVY